MVPKYQLSFHLFRFHTQLIVSNVEITEGDTGEVHFLNLPASDREIALSLISCPKEVTSFFMGSGLVESCFSFPRHDHL